MRLVSVQYAKREENVGDDIAIMAMAMGWIKCK
jgi:hypothetical protein